jgi:Putative porin
MERNYPTMQTADPTSRNRSSLLAATALASVLALAAGLPTAVNADEVSELKAAVAALQKRLDELESRAQVVDETNDRQTDQIAMTRSNIGSWVPNFTFRGDFRYRNETTDQEYVGERNRDRIRVRTGFVAKVNDTIRTEFGLSTNEANNPRAANQTLTDGNSHKNIFLDMAYVEWQPLPDWKFTAGKMRYPWVRTGLNLFFDNDVNPEGLAVNFARGDFFASSIYNILKERTTVSATNLAASGESTMLGGQFGWRPVIGSGRLTLAAGVFDMNSVQGRLPVFSAANGNTTRNTGCIGGGIGCLASDYNLVEVIAEWVAPIAGRPFTVYVDYAKNQAAINDLDTAYSAGFMYGRAADAHTWEFAYNYQNLEKDALYGEFVDSNWNAGNTDGKGHTFRFAYAFARNWTLNSTYFLNKSNLDAAVNVPGVGNVFDRDYKRLQLDMNFRY